MAWPRDDEGAPTGAEIAALNVAEGFYTLDTVMIAPLHMGLFLTFFQFGVGVLLSGQYGRSLGWIGVVLSFIGLIVGSLALRQVVPTEPAQIRDGIVLIALFVWFLVVGVRMWREKPTP